MAAVDPALSYHDLHALCERLQAELDDERKVTKALRATLAEMCVAVEKVIETADRYQAGSEAAE